MKVYLAGTSVSNPEEEKHFKIYLKLEVNCTRITIVKKDLKKIGLP